MSAPRVRCARLRKVALGALAGVGLAAMPAAVARAGGTHPALRLTGGTFGRVVTERIDPAGSNRSNVRLPASPRVSFQGRVAPPVIGEVMVDRAGRLLVAHGRDRLSLLAPDGRALFSARIDGELASGPVPLAGGGTLLVTTDARVFEVSETGAVGQRDVLPWSEVERPVLASPTSDGGAILASGTHLARVGPAGTRGFSTKLPSVPTAVFEWRGLALAVGRDGSVWARGDAGDARPLASFGTPVHDVALTQNRLLALVEHELVAVELETGRHLVVWAEPSLVPDDFAVLPDGRLRLVAGRSTLLELDANGHETARYPLPTSESSAKPASLLIDATGAALVVASSAPLLLVSPQGDATSVQGTGCPDPLRLAPVADGHVVAPCRSGLLRGLSDRAR